VVEPLVKPAVVEPLVKPAVVEPLVKPAVVDPLVKPAVVDPLVKPAVVEPLVKPTVVEPPVESKVSKYPKLSDMFGAVSKKYMSLANTVEDQIKTLGIPPDTVEKMRKDQTEYFKKAEMANKAQVTGELTAPIEKPTVEPLKEVVTDFKAFINKFSLMGQDRVDVRTDKVETGEVLESKGFDNDMKGVESYLKELIKKYPTIKIETDDKGMQKIIDGVLKEQKASKESFKKAVLPTMVTPTPVPDLAASLRNMPAPDFDMSGLNYMLQDIPKQMASIKVVQEAPAKDTKAATGVTNKFEINVTATEKDLGQKIANEVRAILYREKLNGQG